MNLEKSKKIQLIQLYKKIIENKIIKAQLEQIESKLIIDSDSHEEPIGILSDLPEDCYEENEIDEF